MGGVNEASASEEGRSSAQTGPSGAHIPTMRCQVMVPKVHNVSRGTRLTLDASGVSSLSLDDAALPTASSSQRHAGDCQTGFSNRLAAPQATPRPPVDVL